MPYKVNFEFSSEEAEVGLDSLLSVTETGSLIIYGSTSVGLNTQFKGKALSNAKLDEWYEWCVLNYQECVAISYDGKQGLMIGPRADEWLFNPEYFVL
jgi:hypothetical protein